MFICAPFLLMAEQYPIVWLDHISFIHSFIHSSINRHLGFLHLLAVVKQLCCCEHSCASFGLNICCQLFRVYTYVCIGWVPVLCLTKNLPSCFPQQSRHFTLPPAMYKGSHSSTSLPTLTILLCKKSPSCVCSPSFFFFLKLNRQQSLHKL